MEDRKTPTSFRLSAEAREMLEWLSKHLGISQAAMLEMLLRERYRKERGEA